MLERGYQPHVIKEIERVFPGSVILKNDPGYRQGVPDLSVFYLDRWAMLETKRERRASRRPNQNYYINLFNGMSYASFIYPENEGEVFYELQQAFEFNRNSRFA